MGHGSNSAVSRKIQEIEQGGRKALEEGNFTPFSGYQDGLRRRYITALLFGVRETRRFCDLVTGFLTELGENHRLIAVRDFPLHSTLMEGQAEESLSRAEVTGLFERLARDHELRSLRASLQGLQVPYSRLIPDANGNVLLVCNEIPPKLIAAREELDIIHARHGLKPLPIKDLLHATVARPTTASQLDVVRFLDKLNKASRTLVPFTVADTSEGNTYDFLTRG